jgi:predicted RNA-binding Zn ribbon-like protein
MTPPMPALFLADSLGLDFLNSVATPADTPVDWLADGDGLLDWLRQAGMAQDEALRSVSERALPGEVDRLAGQARALREWFRGFVGEHRGRPLPRPALAQLEPINELLERDHRYWSIAESAPGEPGAFTVIERRRWQSPESLLLPIAEAMAQLVCEEDFTHVKGCEGPACTLLFADHTRGHARRWCSMALCGNRAKQAAHRRRQKAAADPA